MRVLVAFDKFKDSLSATEACGLAATTLEAMHPEWEIDTCPLTDGGDGFAEILTGAARGVFHEVEVTGPRGDRVVARFGVVDVTHVSPEARGRLGVDAGSSEPVRIGIVDMASASGLALLPNDVRNPWASSSYGTGELLLAAALVIGLCVAATVISLRLAVRKLDDLET